MRRWLILLMVCAALLCPRAQADPQLDFRSLQERAWYIESNAKYFGGRLPAGVYIYQLHAGVVGATDYLEFSKLWSIGISPEWNPTPDEARITLYHEMCHIWVATVSDVKELDSHGLIWKGCMRNLAFRGAFDELW
jgi:SprT-like family